MLVGMWLSVELYQLHLQDVGEFVGILAYTKEESAVREYVEELKVLATALSVELVFVDTEYDENGGENITFYCEGAIHDKLQKEYWYRGGTVKSIFFGTTTVEYKTLSELDAKKFTQYEYSCYLCGEDDDVGEFLFRWDQEGEQIIGGKGIVKKNILIYLLILWGVIACVICCMTIFERMLGRKEFFVRLSIGESLVKSSLLHIASDVAVYFGSVGVSMLVIGWLCGNVCFPAYAWMATGIMSAVSVVLYVSLSRNSFRYAFSNAMMSDDTLLFGHFLLACFIAVLLTLVPFVCSTYRDYHRVASQQEFYEPFRGCYRVSFEPYSSEIAEFLYGVGDTERTDPFLRSDAVNRKFYEENFERYSVSTLAKYAVYSNISVCYVNANMKSYLEDLLQVSIPEGYDAVCFYPERYHPQVLKQWKLETLLYSYDGEASMHWIPYDGKVVTSTTGYLQQDFALVETPVFVYEAVTSFEEGAWETRTSVPYSGLYYCKCSEEEVLAYADANDVNVHYEDVYGYYYEYYAKAKSSFWCMLSVSVILAAMIVFLHITIIRLECLVNSTELAIKKTLGISLFDRFFKMYVVTIGFSALGVAFSFVLMKRLEHTWEPVSLIVGAALILIQLVIVTLAARRIETKSIQKVLKNG